MKIDFKQPRYAIPLIILPFLFLGFYTYESSAGQKEPEVTAGKDDLQSEIGGVSEYVRNQDIDNKLEAFRNRFRDGDGYTAIEGLDLDIAEGELLEGNYNAEEKRILDSIDLAFKTRNSSVSSNNVSSYSGYQNPPSNNSNSRMSQEDIELANALAILNGGGQRTEPQREKFDDPMEVFKEQMRIIDSVGKANDPEYQKNLQREELLNKIDEEVSKEKKLDVVKAKNDRGFFNTVQVGTDDNFIKAIVDENVTGYLGSRLRIRLLDDIKAGKHLIKKGTYVYANISGYDAQRVKLTITSVMTDNKILPIKLSLYDLDGMEGLYIPASAFRDFTKELGGNGMSGMQMQQNPESMNQFYLSMIQQMFTSTSQAMAKMIKANKAKIKYGTMIYLIDQDELRELQNNL